MATVAKNGEKLRTVEMVFGYFTDDEWDEVYELLVKYKDLILRVWT